jgi:hypothetical protein
MTVTFYSSFSVGISSNIRGAQAKGGRAKSSLRVPFLPAEWFWIGRLPPAGWRERRRLNSTTRPTVDAHWMPSFWEEYCLRIHSIQTLVILMHVIRLCSVSLTLNLNAVTHRSWLHRQIANDQSCLVEPW